MSSEGDRASVTNAANWLRLIFHALTCNNPDCVLEARCEGGRALLSHVLTCANRGACTVPSCTSVRRLTLHWLGCQDTDCRLCAVVWRDLSGYDQVQEGQFRGGQSETLPFQAPGTPKRNGDWYQQQSTRPGRHIASFVGERIAPSAQGLDARVMNHYVDLEFHAAVVGPGRAVVQLQEATSYMRYLLYCLMRRNAQDTAARNPGQQFWLHALQPLETLPESVSPVFTRTVAPASAGHRLVRHRLMCQNSYCALCSGTCELFTRGQALRRHVPIPRGLHDMDHIVQELSMALRMVNL